MLFSCEGDSDERPHATGLPEGADISHRSPDTDFLQGSHKAPKDSFINKHVKYNDTFFPFTNYTYMALSLQ